MKHCFRLATIVLALTYLSTSSYGQTAAGGFTVQGRLTDMNGVAIPNGMHTIHASVYADGSATATYSETDTATTTDGVFSILLGSGSQATGRLMLRPGVSYTLGISVDGHAELSPRIQIASVPFAANAHLSDTAQVANVADTANFALGITGAAADTIESAILAGVGNSIVTSINGLHGNVILQGGGNLGLTTSGDTLSLSFSGTGGGLTLPFTQTLGSAGGLFNLTNSAN